MLTLRSNASRAVGPLVLCLVLITTSCSSTDEPAATQTGPAGAWTRLAKAPLDVSRNVVWTGDRLLVLDAGSNPPKGQSYDPGTDRWTIISMAGAQRGPTVVWAGDRMLVIGGQVGKAEDVPPDVAAFDPSTNRWSPRARAPRELSDTNAVWTGREIFDWRGAPELGETDQHRPEGILYDPAQDRWRQTAKAPLAPGGPAVILWTGARVIIWGGGDPGVGLRADGALYDPAADRWTKMSAAPFTGRAGANSVWTGSKMIVWGGAGEDGPTSDGAAYDPATDRWTKIASSPLTARLASWAVWTGSKMIVWGVSEDNASTDGAEYDPATDRWRPIAAPPLDPGLYTSVWTGERMIVWGSGCRGEECEGIVQGASFDPAAERS